MFIPPAWRLPMLFIFQVLVVIAAALAVNIRQIDVERLTFLFCYFIFVLFTLCLISLYSVKRVKHSAIRAFSLHLRAFQSFAFVAAGAVIFIVSLNGFSQKVERLISSQLPADLEKQDLYIEGQVETVVSGGDAFQKFDFKLDRLARSPSGAQFDEFGGKVIRLSWRRDQAVSLDEKLKLVVRLKRPRGFVNLAAFDYQLWLLNQGLVATGYVRRELRAGSTQLVPTDFEAAGAPPSFHLGQFRLNLISRLSEKLSSLEHLPLIKALLVGDKQDIPQAQWALFLQTGTIHLMAISGLHIGMIALIAAYVVAPFKRVLGMLCHPYLSQGISLLFVCGACWLYAFLAGFSVPTLRAFLCVSTIALLWMCGRHTSFLLVLGFIAIAMLIDNPLAILTPGFVLSFFAVLVLIVAFTSRRGSANKRVRQFFKAQWVMFFALLPMMSVLGLPFAVVSPLANMNAIPMITFLILPTLLFGLGLFFIAPDISITIFAFADALLALLMAYLDLVAYPENYIPVLSPIEFGVLACGLFLLLLPRTFCLGAYGGVALATLFCSKLFIEPNARADKATQYVEMTVLDVGQGLSVVFDDGLSLGIYDIGAKFSDDFSIANRVLLPFLKTKGKRQHYELVLSHSDNDHAGDAKNFVYELEQLQRRYDASQTLTIWSGEPARVPVDAWQCTETSQIFSNMNIQTRVVWPSTQTPDFIEGHENANNNSCVLVMYIGELTVVLMGDVEKRVEYQLLRTQKLPQQVDVLIAGHHGSSTSSIAALVRHLSPKHVVFSAGYKNRYGHPAKKVEARFKEINSIMWNTAHHGALTFTFNAESNSRDWESAAQKLSIRAERCHNQRLWFINEGHCAQKINSGH